MSRRSRQTIRDLERMVAIVEVEREVEKRRADAAEAAIDRLLDERRADIADLTELRCALARATGVHVESDPAGEMPRPVPLVRPPATGAPIDPVQLPRVRPDAGRRSA